MSLLSMGEWLGGWSEGCVVMLLGVWLFLALLGIRNSRFPWRIVGGGCFVVGSALWLGVHRELAASLRLESGFLGFLAHKHLVEPLAGSTFGVQALGATLIVCSLFGLLVAIDWLPLLPLAPLIAALEQRMRLAGAGAGAAAGAGAGASGPAPARPSTAMLRTSAAAVLEREPKARPIVPPTVTPPAPATETAPIVEAAPIVAATVAEAAAIPSVSKDASISEPPDSVDPIDTVEAADATAAIEAADATDDEPPVATNWARFRPRAPEPTPDRAPVELPVDNAPAATHNSPTPEAEGAASEAAPTPAAAPDEKDPPVLEHDLSDASSTSTALAEPPEAAAPSAFVAPLAPAPLETTEPDDSDPTAETLAPKRKKEDPEEEPEEKPDDDEEEGDDKEDEDWEEEEGEEEDDEEEDKEWDEEKEDKEEDWDEDEKKEGEDKDDDKDEKDDEDEEDDEEEEEDEDDEDWEEDEEEDEDEEDDEDDDKEWEGDENASAKAQSQAPAAESVVTLEPEPESAAPVADDVDAAPIAFSPSAVEIVAPKLAPLVAPTVEPRATAIPSHLFKDLPSDERELLVRAVDLIAGTESVSLSRLQRELGVTYYASARVFERLEKEGFVAPYSGSLARAVKVTREEWESRRRA